MQTPVLSLPRLGQSLWTGERLEGLRKCWRSRPCEGEAAHAWYRGGGKISPQLSRIWGRGFWTERPISRERQPVADERMGERRTGGMGCGLATCTESPASSS